MSAKLIGIIFLGVCFHIWGLGLNEVLKVADSFAYLQMSHFLKHLSIEGLGSGWFGFLYSLPIAIIDIVIQDDFLSGKIVNILLLVFSVFLLHKIALKYLSESWSLLVVILFFLSPTFLHFNIHILSENMYIPIFLGVFLTVQNMLEDTQSVESPGVLFKKQIRYSIILGCLLGFMYLTRAEAFIYILSIAIISISLVVSKKISFQNFIKLGVVFFISFFLLIFPYLYHMQTLTGNWGLTNKGASNLRQAELRGIQKMDDSGFEKAVAELTDDKHHLIAGFAGGMKYDTPQIEGSLISFISQDPQGFFSRISQNQIKLFTKNIPEIFLGKAPKLFLSDDARFSGNIIFLIVVSFPLVILIYGIYCSYIQRKKLFFISCSFFIPALIFFTLFFTLNRYFLIFLPLLLIFFTYGVQQLSNKKNIMGSSLVSFLLISNILGVFFLSNVVYFNTEKNKDSYYGLKKEAGEWLQENYSPSPTMMERFPIVTYYSGSKQRWITPYEEKTENIIKYAQYNNIDILVVDTMDFLTYRPFLKDYLETSPIGMRALKTFSNSQNQKVILYEFKK